MIVVGAGLSGLIAASVLRDQCHALFEQQISTPNNHSALLRFRTPVVGDAVGVPFRKVKVMKAVQSWKNPVADAMMYSLKSTGKSELRSVVTAKGEVEERFIAPDDFISRLVSQAQEKIFFEHSMQAAIESKAVCGANIISTIPMPSLMSILGWEEKPEFGSVGGTVINCDLPEDWVNACVTVYLPDPSILAYRASITDRKLIIEISDAALQGELSKDEELSEIQACTDALGISYLKQFVFKNYTAKRMKYAKITPIDENIRKKFIMWASEEHGIFSLGRFATWRPGLLLDDIINDVRVIQRISRNSGEAYAHKKKG
jgi:hypothetical protein